MRLLFVVFAALVVLLVSVLASDEANSDQNSEIKTDQDAQTKCKLARLFDFEPFKRVYHKHYASAMEEMRRLKTFLARSYQVFVTAVGYSHGLKSYYLRVSEWSDLLPEELEAMRNKFVTSGVPQKVERGEALVEPKELSSGLELLHTTAAAGPELRLPADETDKSRQSGLKRSKRESGKIRSGFSIEQAFAMRTEGAPDKAAPSTQSTSNCPGQAGTVSGREPFDYSALPDYKSISALRVSRRDGRVYDDLPVKGNYDRLNIPTKIIRLFQNEQQLARVIADRRARASMRDGRPSEHEDDVLWVDHRIGGCFQPVQNQGLCGSCYAFSMIAYLEWLHCSTTTERIKLSEQYIVDCGPQLDESLRGCSGGNVLMTSEFISNFGLELAKNYPYFGSENRCPHEPGKDLNLMGYLRADASNVLLIDMHDAEHYLDRWAIMVDIQASDDFMWYGGGVWVGKSCNSSANHSVLIVGHGREDGEEYWLIRNSHGLGWGEQGHLKLNKNSKCIFRSRGSIFGTRNGKDLRLTIRRNEEVAEPARPKPSFISSVLKPMQAIKVLTKS